MKRNINPRFVSFFFDNTNMKVPTKTAAEIVKENSDFSALIAELNVTSDVGKYFLSVVTPRLGRMGTVPVEKKRELITALAKRLNGLGKPNSA